MNAPSHIRIVYTMPYGSGARDWQKLTPEVEQRLQTLAETLNTWFGAGSHTLEYK